MSETIRDGKGRGFLAEVNDRNKMMNDAVIQTEEADIAELGCSFIVSTKILTLNSTNPHLVLYFKNTNNLKTMRIWVSNFGWNGGSTNHNRTLKWSWVIAPNEPSANHTLIVPGNLNFASNNIAEALAYKWDGVGDGMTYSGGIIVSEAIFAQGYSNIESRGIPILGLNDSFGVVLTGEEIGDIVVTTRFYYK